VKQETAAHLAAQYSTVFTHQRHETSCIHGNESSSLQLSYNDDVSSLQTIVGYQTARDGSPVQGCTVVSAAAVWHAVPG
jgi:hypothetical protein